MRIHGWFLALAGTVLATSLAGCGDDGLPPLNPGRGHIEEYCLTEGGVALGRYSAVSYVDDLRAELGNSQFGYRHQGIMYHFTSEAQIAAFKADPGKYEPAFGGWCAFGAAHGRKDRPDPKVFKIIEGKLLLFSKTPDHDALDKWNEADAHQMLAAAEAWWQSRIE